MLGVEFKMCCNSICVSLVGMAVSLVCSHTQLFLFQKHLQYKPIAQDITPIAEAEVPMIENVFTFIDDHELRRYVPSFVSMLFMLLNDINFISGIL